jgi:hypothetical protein
MSSSRKLSVALVAIALCVTGAVAPRSMASPHVVRANPHAFASVIASAATSTSTTTSTSTAAGSYTSRVIGTFGRAGTVRGQFVPLRSIVRSGNTYVAGNLTATLRRGDGTLVGRVTRHDVQLPVMGSGAHMATAAAVCNILHLVLGPLNLNLLGLVVHLNRVVLDITAVSGPGNLLGNLLCAVAHLLDGTSPTLTNLLMLANLLNRVIGLVT